MAIPPPRKPLAPREPEPEPEVDDNDPAARRRRLREAALRGRKQVNLALGAAPPPMEGGALPPMPSKGWPWWKYLLVFPLVLGVLALLIFTLMVDPSDLQSREKVKLSAILGFSLLAQPPAEAKNVLTADPSETPNKKYALRFDAPIAAIDQWIASSVSLKGVEPVKSGLTEIYTVIPAEGQDVLRRTEVKVDKYAKTVEVVVDGYKAPVAESNVAFAERRRREEKAKAAAAAGTPLPASPNTPSGKSSPFSPAPSTPPAAPVNSAEAERLAREAEVMRIMSRGGAGNIRLQNSGTSQQPPPK